MKKRGGEGKRRQNREGVVGYVIKQTFDQVQKTNQWVGELLDNRQTNGWVKVPQRRGCRRRGWCK